MEVVPNTLDAYYCLPQRVCRDLSALPVFGVRKAMKDYLGKCGRVDPHIEALEFYLLNHLVGLLRGKYARYERLPEWANQVVAAYCEVVTKQSTRLTTYLMLITLRESRHYQDDTKPWWNNLPEEFSPGVRKLINRIHGTSGTTVINVWTEELGDFTKLALGEVHSFVDYMFRENTYSSGFGGLAWASVAKPLLDMIEGRLSLEMLIDVGYTLAHNGGPIFNKGMTYDMMDGDELIRVLNIQRAGMIPGAMVSYDLPHYNGSLPLRTWVLQAAEEFGDFKYNSDTVYEIAQEVSEAAQKQQKKNLAYSNAKVELLSELKEKLMDDDGDPAPYVPEVPANGKFHSQYVVWPKSNEGPAQIATKYSHTQREGVTA